MPTLPVCIGLKHCDINMVFFPTEILDEIRQSDVTVCEKDGMILMMSASLL